MADNNEYYCLNHDNAELSRIPTQSSTPIEDRRSRPESHNYLLETSHMNIYENGVKAFNTETFHINACHSDAFSTTSSYDNSFSGLASAWGHEMYENLRDIYTSKSLRLIGSFCIIIFIILTLEYFHVKPQTLENKAGFTGEDFCDKQNYRGKTLKLAHEQSIYTLFKNMKMMKKFEASDVVRVGDALYAVCDSSFALARTNLALEPFSDDNYLIGEPKLNGSDDSQWEALYYDPSDNLFYAVREAIKANEIGDSTDEKQDLFYSYIQELAVSDNAYTINGECQSEMVFTSGNKGFEGVAGIRMENGELLLLGLCEGNYCKGGEEGKDSGHGRIIVMQKVILEDKCMWKTVKKLKLPKEIDFHDYSSIAVRGNRIAITSQEDSLLWIGKLNAIEKVTDSNEEPVAYIDSIDNLQVLPGGHVLFFPRDNHCEIMYCNIEGITFINDRLLAAASDQMKAYQDHRCKQKDQSLHVFSLPSSLEY